MNTKVTLTAIAAAAVMMVAAPQSASALPNVDGAKKLTSSNVEKAHYRHGRRGWRHRHYRRHYGYGYRHYRRRPGFGIYLGF